MRKREEIRKTPDGKWRPNVIVLSDEPYAILLSKVAKINEAFPGLRMTPRRWLEAVLLGGLPDGLVDEEEAKSEELR